MQAAGFCVVAALTVFLWFRWIVASRYSQFLGRSIYRGAGKRPSIALTFDDGPSPQTLELAQYLSSEGVRASFFVCGVNVQRHPDVIRRLVADGHELGNHTWSHARLCPRLGWRCNLLPPATVIQEVYDAQAIITEIAGIAPRLVRAPYGLRWFGMGRAQTTCGLLHVLWTVIGHDWEWDQERVTNHVLRSIRPGAILCLHDGRDTRPDPDITVTLEAVKRIVPELKRRGYRFETVSELLVGDETPLSAGSRQGSVSSSAA